jgi:DNA-binding NtrC family response regulator
MPVPRHASFKPDELWEHAREPAFWLDQALRLTWVNRAWESLTGHSAESVVGLTCQPHGSAGSADLAALAASFHPPPESLAGQPSGTLALLNRAGGPGTWHRIEFWPFRAQDGGLIGLLGWVRSADDQPSFPDSKANQLRAELLAIRQQLEQQAGLESLIGCGPAHRRLLDQVQLAAGSTTAVLLVGETGTGKRHVARAIHQSGPRRASPLVPFDCESLPAEVLERELFGLERSAAGGASPDSSPSGLARPRLSLGDGSTLLIHEILMLPRDLQARLVAALDGPVRLLATTSSDVTAALEAELIRPELYFAITTLVIRLDPLRQRRQELPVLAQHLLERANQREGESRIGFSSEALAALMAYDWPGNLRELARVVDHACAGPRGEGSLVAVEDLPYSVRGNFGGGFAPPSPPRPMKPLDELLIEVERRSIETAVRLARGNKSRAAELLGISRPRLYRRIQELSLPEDAESADEIDAQK